MELTTPQIYALFAISTAVIVLIGITYCTGLKTGRSSAGYLIGKLEKINAATSKSLAKRTTDLIETNRLLDSREAALSKLRQCLREEQADHDKVNKRLREDLHRVSANGLTQYDWLTLKLAAKQLGVAAYQFTRTGSSKTNQAALAQARLNDMAGRVKALVDEQQTLCESDTPRVTDTTLIEWLNKEAGYQGTEETGELRFPVNSPPQGFEHLRDVLVLAIQQQAEGNAQGFDRLELASEDKAA